jgi:hypothetical protein
MKVAAAYTCAMTTFAYLFFVFVASLLGALLGAAGHFARAHFTYFPEDTGLGEPWDGLLRDDYQFEKHVIGAKWDDNGFWDADSNRNLIYYVVSGFITPPVIGFIFWSYREDTVGVICRGFTSIGLTPLICP